MAWLPTAIILAVSTSIFNFLGPRGAVAVERLMGILLVMLSVQMVLDGIGSVSDVAGLIGAQADR